ncbi:hypothetical protein A3D66_00130 [Candidatus Kaiserbacteria bacterium RIFCSPHIGHO2_02_FULL_50_9]|uniref:Cyclase n=1 Tax=Candidatus Kaiserbacteria bacterium RIFCSPLOWO2_01_FULL_51_21 TaxID=1798508 RepID=A0A1F6EE91_9BACT|nr:MAG: hypothetical protein A2761_01975 [Candidatus Kaiserbacteria bacterium RIFCSPHIGHO2_01_FULL_51_33]OGG63491.1 MAG: hypothetical protein A3D66_00130 [Candidatus Kaiserbacteria bacterium RIFCSPHIGHO2_02_FULL_50_9]OGG71522.1 MAG: hypothetical protein A3A35_02190 [Candidatus Kaiserbacteria bacterium RIFCSPLOWO2_01_FULL_51_21]
MKIIDLTLPLYTGMPVYPGDPEASIELIQTIEKNGWNMRRIEINSHDGTHVNAPLHFAQNGKTLDDYSLEDFCGPARMYDPAAALSPDFGVIFREQNIDAKIAEEIKRARPHFIGLSSAFEFDVEIEKELLQAGSLSFERLCNLEQLPDEFMFYGMPLKIKGGDGSPVRAFAVIE